MELKHIREMLDSVFFCEGVYDWGRIVVGKGYDSVEIVVSTCLEDQSLWTVRIRGRVTAVIGPVDRYDVDVDDSGALTIVFLKDSMRNYLIPCGSVVVSLDDVGEVRCGMRGDAE